MKNSLRIFAASLLLFASTAVAEKYNSNAKTYFTFEKLVQTIEADQIRSIEELLPKLPAEFKSDYVLMYKSRSLQQASFEFPRVIMFGNDATLVMTFNGHPAHSGFENIEIIQFRGSASRFEFREIAFGKDSKPAVSEANPAKCLKCHQSPTRTNVDMRPNWEPYNIWPGSYGSHSGGMRVDYNNIRAEKNAGQDKELLEILAMAKDEDDEFEKHAETWRNHPRYKVLTSITRQNVHENQLAITQRLSQLNYKRISRLMSETRLAGVLVPAAKDLMFCRQDLDEVFPPRLASAFKSHNVRVDFSPPSRDIGLSRLASVFEPAGVDTNDWSMSFNIHGRLAFSSRFGTPGVPDHEFESVVFPKSQTCSDAKAVVSSKLRELDLARYIQGESPRMFLNACAKCHTGPEPKAPPISFDNPQLLAAELKTPGYERGTLLEEIKYRLSESAKPFERMPEGFHLAPHQNKILIDYLSGL